jgi:hypothetical protein
MIFQIFPVDLEKIFKMLENHNTLWEVRRHVEFQINTNNLNLVNYHLMNIPAKFSVNRQISFREENWNVTSLQTTTMTDVKWWQWLNRSYGSIEKDTLNVI